MFVFMKAVVVALAVLGGVTVVKSAQAIELRNETEARQRVKITSPTMDKDIEVRPMTLSLVVCIEVCTFVVDGVGTVEATRDDVVTIRDGEVFITPGKLAER